MWSEGAPKEFCIDHMRQSSPALTQTSTIPQRHNEARAKKLTLIHYQLPKQQRQPRTQNIATK